MKHCKLAVMVLLLLRLTDAQFDEEENDQRSVVEYDFAFMLEARERTCFYQYMFAGSQMKFSYRVLTSSTSLSTNAIRVDVKDLDRTPIGVMKMNSEGEIPTTTISKHGDIEFCFNNYHGRFLRKKIDVFIGIINPKTAKEEEIESSKNKTLEAYDNLQDQVFNIIGSLFHVSHFMFFSRRLENADMAALQEKLTFINRSSVVMSILIVIVAVAQVYALRRLFRTRLATANKPRA